MTKIILVEFKKVLVNLYKSVISVFGLQIFSQILIWFYGFLITLFVKSSYKKAFVIDL